MTLSKALFYAGIAFIVGIALAEIVKIPQIFVWGVFVLGILLIITVLLLENTILFKHLNFMVFYVFGLCALCLVLGIMRFEISQFNITFDVLSKFNDSPNKITLIGQVIDDPDVRDTLQKLKVKVKNSLVLVTVGRYPEYRYLDYLELTGKLKTPLVFESFNYKNYLAKDGIYSVMDYPAIKVIDQEKSYNFLTYSYEKILWVKENLMQSLDSVFFPPNSDLLKGIVFGNDKNMTKDLKDKFNATGLSHITAVSGTNIVILIEALMVFLLFLGFWRGQAFYFALIIIWLYIIMIGLPVSGVRAVIMGSVGLLAQKLGRQNTSARVLIFTACVMLLQNPMLLFYDISFQLSFLASLGIIYIKPLIDYFFNMVTDKFFRKKEVFGATRQDAVLYFDKAKYFLDILSITLASQIITLPIIVYNFGRISLVAPITNLLVLPIISFLTILGFIVSVVGIFSITLGFIVSLPCWFLLAYLISVVEIFSGQWALFTIQNLSWGWVVFYYIFLFILISWLNRSQKSEFLGY